MNKSGPRALELSEGAILDAVESYERRFYRILYNFLGRGLYFKFKRLEWRDIFHPNQPNFRNVPKIGRGLIIRDL